jgi:predicted AlkP superfamily pyrophosphatase or phosphodiesterase
LFIALAIGTTACRGSKETATAPKRGAFREAPVIIVSIDTLRADHLPAYGYRGVETPNIDAFRRGAILFENAYSHVPLTLPSHVSILSGLIPPENGVRNNVVLSDHGEGLSQHGEEEHGVFLYREDFHVPPPSPIRNVRSTARRSTHAFILDGASSVVSPTRDTSSSRPLDRSSMT